MRTCATSWPPHHPRLRIRRREGRHQQLHGLHGHRVRQEVRRGHPRQRHSPGFFITEQNRTLLTNPDGSYTQRGKDVIHQTPFGRMGDPEELCGTIHYLMSDAAKFVTGTVAVVDGGFNSFAM